jgi:guanyl-specific ribonuclease Sa
MITHGALPPRVRALYRDMTVPETGRSLRSGGNRVFCGLLVILG